MRCFYTLVRIGLSFVQAARVKIAILWPELPIPLELETDKLLYKLTRGLHMATSQHLPGEMANVCKYMHEGACSRTFKSP